ncbi:hypothetical protein K505DRAFT_370489 [Melanomma pulvis-pyrius CBS 109.77]|uniref:Ubiquitin-like protease family profile domain-containing protein n=1 Tax=Melanomma pulvis-pyrius CBS 109.77 TaxID=1314802 RepID=A0A6A6XUC3_9PLEO|nr:hypothetical protein K505DRAFT_370489 [Melanomma pulvis-pyrius CBS 109.77]
MSKRTFDMLGNMRAGDNDDRMQVDGEQLAPSSSIALEPMPGQFPGTVFYADREPSAILATTFTTVWTFASYITDPFRFAQAFFGPQQIRAESVCRPDGSRKKILLDDGLVDVPTPSIQDARILTAHRNRLETSNTYCTVGPSPFMAAFSTPMLDLAYTSPPSQYSTTPYPTTISTPIQHSVNASPPAQYSTTPYPTTFSTPIQQSVNASPPAQYSTTPYPTTFSTPIQHSVNVSPLAQYSPSTGTWAPYSAALSAPADALDIASPLSQRSPFADVWASYHASILNSTPVHQKVAATPLSTPRQPKVTATPIGTPMQQEVGSTPITTPVHHKVAATPISTPVHQKVAATPIGTPVHQKVAAKPIGTPVHQKKVVATPIGIPMQQEVASTPIITPRQPKVAAAPINRPIHQKVAATPIDTPLPKGVTESSQTSSNDSPKVDPKPSDPEVLEVYHKLLDGSIPMPSRYLVPSPLKTPSSVANTFSRSKEDDDLPLESLPVENVPVKNVLVENVTVENVTVENVPVENVPVENVPVENVPVENVPVENVPVENVPVENIPDKDPLWLGYENDLSMLPDAPTPPPKKTVTISDIRHTRLFYKDDAVSSLLDTFVKDAVFPPATLRDAYDDNSLLSNASTDQVSAHTEALQTTTTPSHEANNNLLLSPSPLHHQVSAQTEALQTTTTASQEANNNLPLSSLPLRPQPPSPSAQPEGTPKVVLYTGVPDDTWESSEDDESLHQSLLSNEFSEEVREQADVAVPTPLIVPLLEPLSDQENDFLERLAEKTDLSRENDSIAPNLTVRDFKTLLPDLFKGSKLAWLNDNIVNEYLSILINYQKDLKTYKHKKGGPAPPVHNFASQFWVNMCKDTASIARWASKKQLGGEQFLHVKLVLIPICDNSHWRLVAIKPQAKEIHYLDSLNWDKTYAVKKIFKWLKSELPGFNQGDWNVIEEQRSVRQANSSDCGVFTCLNALAMLRGDEPKRVTVSDGMENARRRIALTLINGHPTAEM